MKTVIFGKRRLPGFVENAIGNSLYLCALVMCIFLSLLVAPKVVAADISSYAFVQDDGSLKVDGRVIHLFGIYIPPSAQSCRLFERPVTCAPRAALALDFKIGAEFVHCEPKIKHIDGSIVALCRVDGQDLSAYLLERGWAVALPDAPFEYTALEKIASHKGMGLWGLPLEKVR